MARALAWVKYLIGAVFVAVVVNAALLGFWQVAAKDQVVLQVNHATCLAHSDTSWVQGQCRKGVGPR